MVRAPRSHDNQLSGGSCFKIWDQVQAEGRVMPWPLTGYGSLYLEENHQHVQKRMKLHLSTSLTRVCISPLLLPSDGLQVCKPRAYKVSQSLVVQCCQAWCEDISTRAEVVREPSDARTSTSAVIFFVGCPCSAWCLPLSKSYPRRTGPPRLAADYS